MWLLLYQFCSITLSAKIIVALVFVFYLFAAVTMRRAFGGNVLTDWVAMTCFFGFAFQRGFISFLTGIPVGMLLLTAAKRWLDVRQGKYLWLLTLLGVWAYYSHILTFALFCLLSYLIFLADFAKLTWRQRALFTAPFLLFATMLGRYLLTPDPEPFLYYPETWVNYPPLHKSLELLALPWHMSQVAYYEIAALLLYVLPPFFGCRLSRDKQRWALLGGCLAVWYALPHIGFQTAFIYQRFGMFVPIFWYLLWTTPDVDKRNVSAAQLAAVFFTLSIAALLFKVYSNNVKFDRASAVHDFQQMVAAMPSEKRVLGMFEPALQSADNGLTSHMEYLYFPL
ncbi:hypothetical protein J2T38_001652 [Neisseria perflava]|uniref:hypothetical protein n=1 Tax=Neisseria perflava TaxID=33053 RepID=UPI00209D5055|nr:hypothetical protein [Neisseria perflava]MCP1772816.1 hypothetical protein [Neisseria perflava]